jgi:ribosomal protein S18 acetylase RimI-like enzyme
MTLTSFISLNDAADGVAFLRSFCAAPRELRSPELARLAPPDAHWAQFLAAADKKAASWIAAKNDRCVGRIGASISPTREGVGYVGFFENDLRESDNQETAKGLINAAFSWLRAHGARHAYGPIDRSTWYSYRYATETLEGADHYCEEPFLWEPLDLPAYLMAFRSAGFTDVEKYQTLAFRSVEGLWSIQAAVETGMPSYDLARSHGVSFRPFARVEDFVDEPFYELASEGFRGNFLFEPISLEQFRRLYVPLLGRLDYENLSYFATDNIGRPVGFIIAYCDRGYLVVKTLAVSPDQRNKRTGNALLHAAIRGARDRGLEHLISALVRRDNAGIHAIETRLSAKPTSWRRLYTLMEHSLI